jgi:hypothetical protein
MWHNGAMVTQECYQVTERPVGSILEQVESRKQEGTERPFQELRATRGRHPSPYDSLIHDTSPVHPAHYKEAGHEVPVERAVDATPPRLL